MFLNGSEDAYKKTDICDCIYHNTTSMNRNSRLRHLIPTFLLFAISQAFAQPVPLSFQVDMSNEIVSSDGVHIAGTFQDEAGYASDWSPGITPLLDPDGDQVYELTVMVPPGNYLYKFVNGNEWSDKPELPSADCAVDDGGGNFNRQVTVGSSGINLPVVKFDSCNAILRLSVNMEGENISPQGVHVMGNFQQAAGYVSNWDPTSIPMQDLNGDGTYEAAIEVAAGSYQYLFVNGNSTADAESLPSDCTITDNSGNQVRAITVQVGDDSAPVYCFNSCMLCDPSITTNYETYWWNDVVFYEIFVRSFYDSDGDGIGDFQGIIERLDYLNDGDPNTDDDLGIGGIWLMPMMESPSYHGYDVTNYYATEPDYGSMEDFEALIDACHERGIKVIIDFVMNHSSNQHPWFTQSANNQNGYRDWYIWSDNHPGYNGPWGQNVWHSYGGDYYYGLFWGGMPDLNYSHPPVKEELFEIAAFWLDKGVDGFRLDAIKYLDEDGSILENTPETFQLLEDFNILYKSANSDAVTVGEVWSNTASILPYIQNNRLDVCFEFDLAYSIINAVNTQSTDAVYNHLQTIRDSYPKLQYATFLTNHDIDRIFSQLGADVNRMKLAASIYLSLPGIPFLYYGEEVGLTGTGAHENIRRPMQWSGASHAGFSTVTPWNTPGSNYPAFNVETMNNNPASLLNHYRQLIRIRNERVALRKGYLLPVTANSDQLLSYARIYNQEAVVVTSNMGTNNINPDLSLAISSLAPGEYQVIELQSEANWGSISINSNGGFTNWQPSGASLSGRESWILLISQNPTQSNPSIDITPPSIQVFPNPAKDYVQIQWEQASKYTTQVEIFNTTGMLLQAKSFDGNEGRISLEKCSSGLHLIRITQDNQQHVFPLVIE